MTTNLSPLFAERYFEAYSNDTAAAQTLVWTSSDTHQFLFPGTDNIIMPPETIEARTNLASIKYKLRFIGDQTLRDDQYTQFQAGCYWLPVFNEDAEQTVETMADVADLFERAVIKSQSINPATAWTPTASDYNIQPSDGVEDLIWRPDRLPLEVLVNPIEGVELWRLRDDLGFIDGKAHRINADPASNSAVTKPMMPVEGMIRRGINTMTPGYIVWYCTIPPNFVQAEWATLAEWLPRNRLFETLRFNAPTIDRIDGSVSILPSTTDDWRRWSIKQNRSTIDAAVRPDGFRSQKRISIILDVTYFFSRSPVGMITEPGTTTSGLAEGSRT